MFSTGSFTPTLDYVGNGSGKNYTATLGSGVLTNGGTTLTYTIASIAGNTNKVQQGDGLPSTSVAITANVFENASAQSATGSVTIGTDNSSPNQTRLF